MSVPMIMLPPAPGSIVPPTDKPFEPQPVSDALRKFAKEMLKDFVISKAADRAGISHSHAYQAMYDPRIKALIAEGKKQHSGEVDIAVDMVLNNFAIMTRVSVADYFHEVWYQPPTPKFSQFAPPAELQIQLIPPSEWSDDMRAACKSLKQTKDGWQIEIHDKVAANVNLGRFFDIFTDTTKMVGPGGGPLQMITPTMSPEDAARAWQDTLNAGKA